MFVQPGLNFVKMPCNSVNFQISNAFVCVIRTFEFVDLSFLTRFFLNLWCNNRIWKSCSSTKNTSEMTIYKISNFIGLCYINLLFCFYRQISITTALTIIINHIYSKEQIDKVNFMNLYACKSLQSGYTYLLRNIYNCLLIP